MSLTFNRRDTAVLIYKIKNGVETEGWKATLRNSMQLAPLTGLLADRWSLQQGHQNHLVNDDESDSWRPLGCKSRYMLQKSQKNP